MTKEPQRLREIKTSVPWRVSPDDEHEILAVDNTMVARTVLMVDAHLIVRLVNEAYGHGHKS